LVKLVAGHLGSGRSFDRIAIGAAVSRKAVDPFGGRGSALLSWDGQNSMRRGAVKKTSFDQELGRRIRAHRLRLGYSQEKLGAMLGLTFQQVQKYEKGTNRVSSGRLIEIAKLLQVHPMELLEDEYQAGAAPAGAGGSPFEFMQNSRALKLLKAFSQIRDRDLQNTVVDLCELMVRQRR
jgi:transcriptional regulator with XRE-family HTH domain